MSVLGLDSHLDTNHWVFPPVTAAAVALLAQPGRCRSPWCPAAAMGLGTGAAGPALPLPLAAAG